MQPLSPAYLAAATTHARQMEAAKQQPQPQQPTPAMRALMQADYKSFRYGR